VPTEGRNGSGHADAVYAALKDRIVQFELRPKERLTEVQLAHEFATSRTPVREALFKLEREGWVVNRPHQGYTVRDFSLEELDDIYEVRIALEWLSVRLACANMPTDDLERLITFWSDPTANASLDPLVMLRCDEDFHVAIAAGTGNQELVRHLQNTNERIRIIRRIDFTKEERVQQTFREHAHILSLIRRKDVETAQKAMEGHIRISKGSINALANEGLARVYLSGAGGSLHQG
jgi:DNA-binding GntR family transcriptional regulator